MRNIEECTAEVFRRSEEKTRKRKQYQKQIAVIVLPLCAVLLCVITLPHLWDTPEKMESSNLGYTIPENFFYGESLKEDVIYGMNESDKMQAGLSAPEDGAETPPASSDNRRIVVSEEDCLILQEFLPNLPYSQYRVCKCLPQYTLETSFGTFGVHLTEGYARCENGQAALTKDQIEIIRSIIERN